MLLKTQSDLVLFIILLIADIIPRDQDTLTIKTTLCNLYDSTFARLTIKSNVQVLK